MNKSTRSLLGIARLPILKSDSGEAWLHNGDGDGEFLDLELFLRQGRQLHVNTPAYHKVRTSTSSSKVSFRWWSPMRSDVYCRSLITLPREEGSAGQTECGIPPIFRCITFCPIR